MARVYQTAFGILVALFGRERNACGRLPNHYWSIVNRYDSFTTTFTIKNTYRTGQHVLCPPRLPGRGGTGHTKNPRALGGEGSFCGQGPLVYSKKAPHSFVETVVRRPFSSALSVSPPPIPPISHKKAFLQKLCASVGMLF